MIVLIKKKSFLKPISPQLSLCSFVPFTTNPFESCICYSAHFIQLGFWFLSLQLFHNDYYQSYKEQLANSSMFSLFDVSETLFLFLFLFLNLGWPLGFLSSLNFKIFPNLSRVLSDMTWYFIPIFLWLFFSSKLLVVSVLQVLFLDPQPFFIYFHYPIFFWAISFSSLAPGLNI